MKQYTPTVAGIDVSKAHLDVYLHPHGSQRRFGNDNTGWRALRSWLAATHPHSVVYEATGSYHKGVGRYLGTHGPPVARLDGRKLTVDVGTMEATGIDALRAAGCNDGEILEVNQVVAYFSYSNRLLNGLGVTTEGDVVGYYDEACHES